MVYRKSAWLRGVFDIVCSLAVSRMCVCFLCSHWSHVPNSYDVPLPLEFRTGEEEGDSSEVEGGEDIYMDEDEEERFWQRQMTTLQ